MACAFCLQETASETVTRLTREAQQRNAQLDESLEEAEQLRADLARVTAERDAARRDSCASCIKALNEARAETARLRERVRIALAYLTDREDVESTPLHAIGHAVQALTSDPETK